MVYTILVLDFDGTYNNEPIDGKGVEPAVYLIEESSIRKAERLADTASRRFMEDIEGTDPIGEIFEALLEENHIRWSYVGSIDLSYGERQRDYLSDGIPRVIV